MSAEDDPTVIAVGGDPTLVMPRPGGQATMVLARAGRSNAIKPGAAAELQRRVAGVNPLLSAANVLIGLVRQLRENVDARIVLPPSCRPEEPARR